MSTTHTPESRGQRARRLFDDLLFANPAICSQCFSRIRDHESRYADGELARSGTGKNPTEPQMRAYDGEQGFDVTLKGAHGARRRYHTATYCAECGRRGTRDSDATSLQRLRGHVDNLVRRLHEQGYFPNLQTLYGTVATLKSKPDHQGADSEILATAVYLAVEADDDAV